MRRIAHLVACLLLLMPAVPMMACVTDAAMSHTESACCREMHNQCGAMAKQGCCTITTHTAPTQLPARNVSASIHSLPIAPLAVFALLPAPASGNFRTLPLEHSPPGLLTAQITVLRI